MTVLTLTYNDTLSSVTATASSLPTTATVALFEVSTDRIQWKQVRGGAAVPITAGTASVNDYEFAPGIPNYYRVSAVSTTAPSFIAVSTAVTASNASVTATVPAGYAEGDLLVIWATIRNTGTGSIVVPAGWTVMLQTDNIALLGRRATAAESSVVLTITGGAAGADVIAQMACFRNCERTPASVVYQKNPSAANITYPGLFATQPNWAIGLLLGWRQSSWTSVATVTGATAEIGDTSSVAGTGAGHVWDYVTETTPPTPIPAGSFVVTGGSAAVSYGAAVMLRTADYITRTTTAITPFMNAVWLKVVDAPYLNRSITLVDWSENTRTARTGFYSVHAQRDAIAYQDVMSPRTVTIGVWADSVTELAAIELVLSVGSVVLVHVPPTCAFPSMYAGVGTYTYQRPAHRSVRALLSIPLTEVTPPDISVVGNTVTWATLITQYATWQAVVDANATWSAVLALQGTPADALIGI